MRISDWSSDVCSSDLNSRFERGQGGHYVKLRSPRVSITDNSFDDSRGHKTNYMIDLPNGASGLIAGNTFVQGKDQENWSGFTVVAAEAHAFPADGLVVRDNDARLRSQERRVGKEGVSTCRSRRLP